MIDVYWWSKKRIEKTEFENFGDSLVPYILSKTTNEDFRWVSPNTKKSVFFFKKNHYIIIGSIIRKATKNSIIWGAGIINSDEIVPKAKFLAVRGPLTRKRLIELQYKVPEKYGDPALLVRLFDREKIEKKYSFGIVPHFIDYNDAKDLYRTDGDVKVIDLLTNDPENVIREIEECHYIISSSLHGIIIGHALRIPVMWVKISDKLFGDDVKFFDYYASLGIYNPPQIPFKKYSRQEIEVLAESNKFNVLPEIEKVDKLIKDLIDTFPFKKSSYFKKRIRCYFNTHG